MILPIKIMMINSNETDDVHDVKNDNVSENIDITIAITIKNY